MNESAPGEEPSRSPGVARRSFLRSSGLVGAGVAGGGLVAAVGPRAFEGRSATVRTTPPVNSPSFYGVHQPGITGRIQAHLRTIAFDLVDVSNRKAKSNLAALMKTWSAASVDMMAGRWVAAQGGVTAGMRPAGLTITLGLGSGAVHAAGAVVPAQLGALPSFASDKLDPARSGGDVAVTVCGDDRLVVSSVSRGLLRLAGRLARPRWVQNGFSPSSAATLEAAGTPRNLMGQLDGTDNPVDSRLELAVWAEGAGTSAWMTGGTYLVARRIRMLLGPWERQPLAVREAVIGRTLSTGTPLSGGDEHSTPDFNHRDGRGTPSIAIDSHLRLTHPSNNSGATMLRRPFSYDDGLRADGEPDAGLFFQAFQTDPHEVFVPVQRRLAGSDALRHFIVHEASALFAIPPGITEGGWIAQPLLEA